MSASESSPPHGQHLKATQDESDKGLTQQFLGTKLRGDSGGRVGSSNYGVRWQDFSMAEITTGGGDVGCNNLALGVIPGLDLMPLRRSKKAEPRKN